MSNTSGARVLPQTKDQSQDQSQNAYYKDNDEETPPLEFSPVPCALDAFGEMLITCFGVILDLVCCSLGLHHSRFLYHYGLGQVLEELIELDESLFDLLDVIVSRTNRTKDAVGRARAVGFKLCIKD